jgi:hypothetical protein
MAERYRAAKLAEKKAKRLREKERHAEQMTAEVESWQKEAEKTEVVTSSEMEKRLTPKG